jgi:hypothetical protein
VRINIAFGESDCFYLEAMKHATGLSKASSGKVSGPLVVILLFSGSFLLFGIIFYVAYRQKLADRALIGSNPISEFTDSATTMETIRLWMADLPIDWVKVTAVEGQGFVIFKPCYAPNATLTLNSNPDSLPRVICEDCDSLEEYAVSSIARGRADSSWDLRLNPNMGRMQVLPVNARLLEAYPEAPFHDKLLLWTKAETSGKTDTLWFIPKAQVTDFEELRAEDENPEGCGAEPAD